MTDTILKIAILDMNAGHPNLGLQSIVDTVIKYGQGLAYEVFDVRAKAEIPDLSFFETLDHSTWILESDIFFLLGI